jgi:hypothetical protein
MIVIPREARNLLRHAASNAVAEKQVLRTSLRMTKPSGTSAG